MCARKSVAGNALGTLFVGSLCAMSCLASLHAQAGAPVAPFFVWQNSRGNTCLHYCYAYKFPDLAEYLLSKGADDSILNLDGMTCYEAEVSGGVALAEVDNI